MGNLSYCRFQNTADELHDCMWHMNDNDLSDEEESARERIIKMAQQIADNYGEEVCE